MQKTGIMMRQPVEMRIRIGPRRALEFEKLPHKQLRPIIIKACFTD